MAKPSVQHAASFEVHPPEGRSLRGREEVHLLDRFLLSGALDEGNGIPVMVFREPRLDSGFPDLVAVGWDPAVARALVDRPALGTAELRAIQLLFEIGSARVAQLQALGGPRILRTLAGLKELGVVREIDHVWSHAPLESIFAVRWIVAIEAKLQHWQRALAQATVNRWFASQSYVLLKGTAPSRELLKSARSTGVGIWMEGDDRPTMHLAATQLSLPRSRASWLVNEWVVQSFQRSR